MKSQINGSQGTGASTNRQWTCTVAAVVRAQTSTLWWFPRARALQCKCARAGARSVQPCYRQLAVLDCRLAGRSRPPASTRKNASMSASVPTSPSALKSCCWCKATAGSCPPGTRRRPRYRRRCPRPRRLKSGVAAPGIAVVKTPELQVLRQHQHAIVVQRRGPPVLAAAGVDAADARNGPAYRPRRLERGGLLGHEVRRPPRINGKETQVVPGQAAHAAVGACENAGEGDLPRARPPAVLQAVERDGAARGRDRWGRIAPTITLVNSPLSRLKRARYCPRDAGSRDPEVIKEDGARVVDQVVRGEVSPVDPHKLAPVRTRDPGHRGGPVGDHRERSGRVREQPPTVSSACRP